MLFVAGVDALGAVAAVEVLVELQAREFFEYRDAIFFSATGVNGGFIDDDVAGFEHLAHRFAGLDERCQVWALVVVNRRWHGDDKAIAGAQIFQVGAEAQMVGGLQFIRLGLKGEVVARFELVDALLVDVKTDH